MLRDFEIKKLNVLAVKLTDSIFHDLILEEIFNLGYSPKANDRTDTAMFYLWNRIKKIMKKEFYI